MNITPRYNAQGTQGEISETEAIARARWAISQAISMAAREFWKSFRPARPGISVSQTRPIIPAPPPWGNGPEC